jgi:hypothetical protein
MKSYVGLRFIYLKAIPWRWNALPQNYLLSGTGECNMQAPKTRPVALFDKYWTVFIKERANARIELCVKTKTLLESGNKVSLNCNEIHSRWVSSWPRHSSGLSRRLPTAAARVRTQVRQRGICGGLSGNGTGFLRVLRFPLPILIPPTAGTISQLVADVPSGLSLTSP